MKGGNEKHGEKNGNIFKVQLLTEIKIMEENTLKVMEIKE